MQAVELLLMMLIGGIIAATSALFIIGSFIVIGESISRMIKYILK